MSHLMVSSSDLTYLARIGGNSPEEGRFAMRHLFSMTAFGFGFYYLWNNNDPTTEFFAVGAMGVALLLEFIAAD